MRAYELHVPDADLDDLHGRLARTRWPRQLADAGWDYGADLGYIRELCEYWRTSYDWRAAEARLNGLPQFRHEIDGVDFHLLHVRSPEPGAVPVLLVHGWPGSIWEFMETIGPLTDPRAYGGDPADAVHVVIPALPGFGWSGAPTERGWGGERIARAFTTLMADLGYDRYAAQGGDWGGIITSHLAAIDPEHCVALHINQSVQAAIEATTPELRAAAAAEASRRRQEGGYSHVQATKPDSLTLAQTDSPAGLAAWIIEKFRTWADTGGDLETTFTKDALLTNLMFYWLPGSTASAARIYYEFDRDVVARAFPPVTVPTAIARFPAEPFAGSRAAVEARYNVVRWTELPAGGHFAAMERPDLLVQDLRSFLRAVRPFG
jgi:pimeloyl-ACP methyl ester carboxylesterase